MRETLQYFCGRKLSYVYSAVTIERGHSSVVLQAIFVTRQFNKPNGHETWINTSLLFQYGCKELFCILLYDVKSQPMKCCMRCSLVHSNTAKLASHRTILKLVDVEDRLPNVLTDLSWIRQRDHDIRLASIASRGAGCTTFN